jgi:hypothetical protein
MTESSSEETVADPTISSTVDSPLTTALTNGAEISYDRAKLIILKHSALNLKETLEQFADPTYNEETDSQLKTVIDDHFTLRRLLAKLNISDNAYDIRSKEKASLNDQLERFHHSIRTRQMSFKSNIFCYESMFSLGESQRIIYIRQCYYHFIQIIFESNKYKRICITGSSGIGKSSFCMVIIMYALRTYRMNILYHSDNHCPIFFRCENQPPIILERKENITNYLLESNTIYLAHNCQPYISLECNCKTVFIHSLNNVSEYNIVRSYNATLLYMPIWTLDELKLCRSAVYGNISQDQVTDAHKYHGGIARIIFASDSANELRLLRKSVKNCNINLTNFNGSWSSIGDADERLLHFEPNPPKDFSHKQCHYLSLKQFKHF